MTHTPRQVCAMIGWLLLLTLVSNAVAHATPPDPDPQTIALRQSLGFRSDPTYLQRLEQAKDVVALAEAGGVIFTLAEAQEFRTRLALEEDGEALRRFLVEDAAVRGAFGGLYLDHAAGSEDYNAGGQLVLQLVETHWLAHQIEALLPPLQHPERLHIDWVAFPHRHLEAQYAHIAGGDLPELQMIFIDERRNRVGVLLNPSARLPAPVDAAQPLDKALLPPEAARLLGDAAIEVWVGTLDAQPQAVRGGEKWGLINGGSGICTLGFEVLYSGQPAMLTAGHCVDELLLNQTIYHGTTAIGTFSGAWMDGTWGLGTVAIDAGILYLNNALAATNDVIHYGNARDISNSLSTYVTGYWRCFTGKTSGTICGPITCTNLTYKSDKTQRWYINMFAIDSLGQQGDSGAPYYRSNVDGTVSVTGIHHGRVEPTTPSCLNGPDATASKWHIIRDWWGLGLVTTD